MIFNRRRREPLLSSTAWRVSISLPAGPREYCIDSGLSGYLSRGYRRILLVYPPEVCSPSALSPRRLEGPDAATMLKEIVEGCIEARRVVDELYEKARPSVRGMALLRPASREEQEYAEARNALLLCEHVFGEELSYALESYKPGFVNYSPGGVEWKRLNGLARLEPRIRDLLGD